MAKIAKERQILAVRGGRIATVSAAVAILLTTAVDKFHDTLVLVHAAATSQPTPGLNSKINTIVVDKKEEPDWDSFGFGLNNVQTDSIWLDEIVTQFGQQQRQTQIGTEDNDSEFSSSHRYSDDTNQCLKPFQLIPLHPASTVLNYGQGIFEGLKAFRRADGTVALFRPTNNAKRMQNGAKRMMLPPVPTETFVKACESIVADNVRWIPPYGKGALYLRPLLFGSGALLGVKPSTHCTFCIYASPVGNYFPKSSSNDDTTTTTTTTTVMDGSTITKDLDDNVIVDSNTVLKQSIQIQVIKGFCRASEGGVGNVKASGNYAPAFAIQHVAKYNGYDEALFVDSTTNEAVEEAGASNFFVVYHDKKIIKTPSLRSGTILPGITRESILELAREECGYTVVDTEPVTLSEIYNANEAFCCGTGAVITPIRSIGIWNHHHHDDYEQPNNIQDSNHKDESSVFHFHDTPGPITQKLYKILRTIQLGNDPVLNEKYKDWIHIVKV